jgi:hypothetical protein
LPFRASFGILGGMPRRSSMGRKDANTIAASIVAHATGEEAPLADDGKNPAAVALGRLGGAKGGAARATKLTAERKREIARIAAEARWGKKRG